MSTNNCMLCCVCRMAGGHALFTAMHPYGFRHLDVMCLVHQPTRCTACIVDFAVGCTCWLLLHCSCYIYRTGSVVDNAIVKRAAAF
jgi:hypothetical protein